MTPHLLWSSASALTRAATHARGTDWVTAQFWVELAQAAILALAGGFTYAQVRQSRLARLAQYRPYVIVYLRLAKTANHLVEIVIENIGATPAEDIHFSFSPGLESAMLKSASSPAPPWMAHESGIKFLAPGQKIVHLFESLIERYVSGLPNEYEVSIQYRSKQRTKPVEHREQYGINFGDWYGSNFLTVNTIDDVAKSLKDMNNHMRSWTEDGRIKVLTSDLEEHREAVYQALEARAQRVGNDDQSSDEPESNVIQVDPELST